MVKTSLKQAGMPGYLLIALTVFFTLVFFPSHGSDDVDRFWLNWIQILSGHSTFRAGFEAIWADYPPFSIGILYLVKEIAARTGADVFVVLKYSVLVPLLATSFLIYRFSQDVLTTLAMHLVLMVSSIMLTYLDIYYAPFLLLSLFALQQGKPWQATIWFAVCCCLKYQPLILAPFFAAAIWKHYRQGDHALLNTANTLLAPALVVLVAMFALVGTPLLTSMDHALFHTRFSFQALNGYWVYVQGMVTLAGADEAAVRGAPMQMVYLTRMVFAVFYLALLFAYIKRGEQFVEFLLFALAGYYSYFALVSGVHENHLFIGGMLASVLYMIEVRLRVLAMFVLMMTTINLLVFNGIDGRGLPYAPVFWFDMTIGIAAVNAVFYFYLFWLLVSGRFCP